METVEDKQGEEKPEAMEEWDKLAFLLYQPIIFTDLCFRNMYSTALHLKIHLKQL